MKSYLFTLSLFLLLATNSFSQAPITQKWDHTFGGDESETLTSLIQTSDSGYVLAGYTQSDSSLDVSQHTRGGTDFWIIKTDSLGIKQWDKRFGGNLEDRLYAISQTTDGGYILGGFTTSDSSGDVSQPTRGSMDYWMVKIDIHGNKQWDKRFGGSNYDRFMSLQQCSDHGYILGGFTYSDSSGDVSQVTLGGEDYWVVKTDSLGNKQWDKRFGGDLTDDLNHLQQTTDGGFLLGGTTSTDSTGDVSQHTRGFNDFWIIKINHLGIKLWDKRYGGSGGEGASSLQQTVDGGFILSGSTSSDSSGEISEATRDTSLQPMNRGDIWSIKIDSVGNVEWDKRFGGSINDGSSGKIMQTKDHGYLIGANSVSNMSGDKSENNFGHAQTWIIKTDSVGTKIWDKTLFTIGPDESGLAIQTIEGCYAFANISNAGIGGFKSEPAKGNNDFWFVKFCESEHPQTPIADFMPDFPGLCSGGCFSFNNISYNSSSFQWYFPGANPSSSTSAFPTNICYSAPGSYNVTLIAINGLLADTLVQQGAITVYPLPIVNIIRQSDTLFVAQGFNYYQWYLNNNPIPFDTNYFHIITQNGNYNVMITDSNGCPGFDTLNFVILGENYLASHSTIHVFPNPAKKELHITGLDNMIGGNLNIYDVVSRKVLSSEINSENILLNIQILNAGIYIIESSYKNQKTFSRFIKE